MTDIVDRRISDDALPALCRERAEAYGALRQSSLTAIALDQAADTIEQLRARIAELDERMHWREEALRHAQGRFLNINIALTTDRGKAVNQAIGIADIGEDACKMALAREEMPVRITRAAIRERTDGR